MSETPTAGLPAEIEQEVERNFRFNFTVNALDGASYWFGYSFIAPATILPLYIRHFTDNPVIIGLIAFFNTAGFLLPQLFTSNWVERTPIKKYFPVTLGFWLERFPVLLMTLSAAFFAKDQPVLALVLFLLTYTWYTAGTGFTVVGWQEMIAKIIPTRRRGRFFGITNSIGNLAGVPGAIAVPFILERYPFPQGFVLLFAAATVLIFMSWAFLSQAREPAVESRKPVVSQTEYLRTLPNVVRKDTNFLKYLIFQSVFALSGMASGFLIVYGAERWNLPDSEAGTLGILMQVGQVAAYLFFGFLADRKGHKLNLEISAAVNFLSFALALAAPSPLWLYPIFFLRGVMFAINFISGISIVMEFTGPDNRPTYIGLANTIPGVAGTAAPLLGGLLAKSVGYGWMFLVSAVVGLVGLGVIRWLVKDPRHVTIRLKQTDTQIQ